MADKNTTAAAAQPDVVLRAKGFWDKFSKPIIYIGSAIIVLIAGWYAYKNFIVRPKELKASELIFPAESLFDKMSNTGFNKDSVNQVLNGNSSADPAITGVLKIINQYGGTGSGNRAKYMAGACYLQIGEFDKAIKYLKEFDGNDASQAQTIAYLMLGHAYSEKKNTAEALSYYKKASTVNSKDTKFTPYALFIAAGYAQKIGNTKEAIEMFSELRDKYSDFDAVKSGDVEKELASLGVFEK